MAQSVPKTTKQWNIIGLDGFDSLAYSEQPVPELGDNQVMVKSTSSFAVAFPPSHLTVH